MAARHLESNTWLVACLLATFACGFPIERASERRHATATALPSGADIQRDERTGTIRFLRAANLSAGLERDPDFRDLQSKDAFADVAVRFLDAYRSLFGLQQPAEELVVRSVAEDDLGMKHVRLQQVFARLPVWGAEILVHLDKANHVSLVQGRYVRTPSQVHTRPRLDRDAAVRIVGEALRGKGATCRNCESELVIALTPEGRPRLAYRVVTKPSLIEGWALMIDAETGAIIEKVSTVVSGGVVSPPRPAGP